MALKDIFKVSGKTFFNPTGWVGYSEVKTHTNVIWSIVRGLFVPSITTVHAETFDEALKRMDLTEEEVAQRSETYLNYALFFITLCVLLVIYAFYLAIVHRTVAGFALGIVSAGLFAAQAFKYHFWYSQIKLRKLGLTYQQWLDSLMGKSPGSTR
jgi:intracellular multiplication protein IcmV